MLRSLGSTPFMSRPPTRIVPALGSSSPTINESSVDFPQPEGPTRMKNSPSAIVRLTSRTAAPPEENAFDTRSRTISAISALHRAGGEPGDDPPLEEQHEQEDGQRDDDGGGGDRAGRLL